MPHAATPHLTPGKVYRTRDFARWGKNPTRLAKRLVREGKLYPLQHGLYAQPKQSSFGQVPPSEEAIMRAFLGSSPFIFTGPPYWNVLGLGSTAMFVMPLIYNKKRSGRFVIGGRTFLLRRVRFPSKPTIEWYVIDLIEHADSVCLGQSTLKKQLEIALKYKRFDIESLRCNAREYGTRRTQLIIEKAIKKIGVRL